jgi:HEAT repeat protein
MIGSLSLSLALVASGSGPADTVRAALQAPEPIWLTWTVPAIEAGEACCWQSRNGRTERGGCHLDHMGGMNVSFGDDRDKARLDDPDAKQLRIFVKGRDGRVEAVSAYSASCEVRSDHRIVSLSPGLAGAQSVAALDEISRVGDASKRVRDGAITALAMHEDSSATAVLERRAQDPDADSRSRKNAAFWLGNTRGEPGLASLRILRKAWNDTLRRELAFPVSQSKAKGAVDELIDMAKNDPAPKVRSQALFWLAQKAGAKSAGALRDAANDDPETEVKVQAVFALSQLRNGEGIEPLIDIGRSHPNQKVRKQAFFWLGQSKDPRAVHFFEEVLVGKK